MDRSNTKKQTKKSVTANTSAIWQHAAHTTDQLTSPNCIQEQYKKASLLTNDIDEFSRKKV